MGKYLTKILGKKCFICGIPEKEVGELQDAHIKAKSRGGKETIPLCPNHHRKWDKGILTNSELRKLHLTREEYLRLLPKKRKKQEGIFTSGIRIPRSIRIPRGL